MNSFRRLQYRGAAAKPPGKKETKKGAKRGGKDFGGHVQGQDDSDAQQQDKG